MTDLRRTVRLSAWQSAIPRDIQTFCMPVRHSTWQSDILYDSKTFSMTVKHSAWQSDVSNGNHKFVMPFVLHDYQTLYMTVSNASWKSDILHESQTLCILVQYHKSEEHRHNSLHARWGTLHDQHSAKQSGTRHDAQTFCLLHDRQIHGITVMNSAGQSDLWPRFLVFTLIPYCHGDNRCCCSRPIGSQEGNFVHSYWIGQQHLLQVLVHVQLEVSRGISCVPIG